MTEIKFYASESCYMFNESTKTYEEVHIKGFMYDVSNNAITYKLLKAGKETLIKDSECIRLFAGEEYFMRDEIMDKDGDICISQLFFDSELNCRYYEREGKEVLDCWYFDGEPIKLDANQIIFDVDLEYIVGNPRIAKVSSNIRRKTYYSYEEASLFNTRKIVDQEGNVTKVKGYGLKLQLTEKQLDLLHKFEAAAKELKESGVELILSCDGTEVLAYSSKYTDGGLRFLDDEDEENLVDVNLAVKQHVNLDMDYYSCESWLKMRK